MNNNQLHFLLLHGAWHGSWVWKEVSECLMEKGFEVSCPTLTGLGERKHLMSKNITIDTYITDVENPVADVLSVTDSKGNEYFQVTNCFENIHASNTREI